MAQGIGVAEQIARDACGAAGPPMAASQASALDFFANYGSYMPRIECIRNASGNPDWPWIAILCALTIGVIVSYMRIFAFWLKGYLAEAPQDRNRKLMDLANIFLWCAICGYAMSLVMFVWPAYRLLALCLLILNIWTFRFTRNLGELSVSFSAKRLERQLRESIEARAQELEIQVAERTSELERARAEAIAANDAKSRFVAMMSHEIRTPMTAILGFAELLGSPDATPAQRAECARTIGRHGDHLVSVINDILDLSKLEAGRMTVDHAPCSPMTALRDVVELYVPRGANKGVRVELVQETPIPETITTDPTRFRQAAMNLVSNAVKFTERGSVRVAVALEGPDGAEQLRVRVIDTGIGLSEEQAARLFQPFAQADTSTTRRFGGTGLGLSITRRLAEMLGGDVSVSSAPGQGSTFTLRIGASPCHGSIPVPTIGVPRGPQGAPAREPDTRGVSESVADAPRRTRLSARVLFADDAPDNRRLFSHHLQRAGAVVDVVADGQAALDRALDAWRRHRAYDAVILDVQMPELDGVQAVAALRAQGYKGLVIALSADAMTESRQRGLEAGFNEYLTKPIAGSVFIDALRAILSGADAIA
jgi:signal transduction histidine kinase/CheY-like chemotaxis protein